METVLSADALVKTLYQQRGLSLDDQSVTLEVMFPCLIIIRVIGDSQPGWQRQQVAAAWVTTSGADVVAETHQALNSLQT